MSEHKSCTILGAGAAGLVQAGELLRKKVLKHEDILILERGHQYGGVWAAATYPGAACDVFSILYQISWWRNPDWTGVFPSRDELVNYYTGFANHFGLGNCTIFGQSVQSASWDETRNLWVVVSKNMSTESETTWTTDVLIQAVGTYNRKKVPTLRGVDVFEGDMWHTVDWPAKYDFTDKRIAYIGTGPTSMQALPAIQPSAKSITIYSRTMTHCHPFPHITYPAALLWMFQHIPGLNGLHAWLVGYGFAVWAWFVFRPGTFLAKAEEAQCKRYLERSIRDPELREKLRARGRFGAKRPLVSSAFFDMVQQHNVELCTEPLLRMERNGIVSGHVDRNPASEQHKESFRQFDVVIWGIGFEMQGWGSMIPTRGLRGTLLSDHWDGEPTTLYGTSTTDFPNLFILNGPNTVAPWASLIRGLELQAAYIGRLIQHIQSRCATSGKARYCIVPSSVAQERWTSSMTAPLDTLATSTKFGPGYYYLSKSGRNTFFFPFTQTYYQWKTRRVDGGNYEGWFA